MHILFMTDNFPPEVNAPASRTFEHCREWVRAGHQVTVITCAPNFPTGKLLNGYRNRLWQSETVEGIRVIRVWSYITANEGFARRIADYVSFMIAGSLAALFVRRPDVIIGTSPQFFTAVGAWIVATLRRKPWVFELRDIWPESIKAVGALQDGFAIRMLERLEMFLYRKASRIVAVTHAFKATLARRGVDPAKIDVVTNGADLSSYAPRLRDPAIEASLGLQGKIVAGYIGTHGLAHGLEVVLDAAEHVAQAAGGEDVVFLLLGDGARKAALVADAERRGLKNVRFVASVPKSEVAGYWSLLNVSIIHLRRSELFETVIPSKMFEAMAMGIPIALGLRGEAADMLEVSGAGEVVEAENGAALGDFVLRIRADRDLAGRYARNGIDGASRYDRRVLAATMLTVLQQVVENSRSRR